MRTFDVTTNTLLHDQLTELFRDKLHLDVPSPDTDLIEAGLLDSLQFVQLVVHLEEDFGTQVSMDDLEIDHFRSIDSIAAFLTNGNPATAPSRP